MTFAAPYDRTTKIISSLSGALMLAFALLIPSHVIGGLLFFTLLAGYLWSPRGYTVQEGELKIKRLIGTVRIPIIDIQQARAAQASDFSGCIRLFGSGGLFGYYGVFRTSSLGRCTWYITDRARAVILITARKTILVSPDNAETFLSTIGKPAPDAAPFSMAAPSRFPVALMLTIVGISLLPLILVPLAFSYNPGPPPYTLTASSLSIKDRFYPVMIGAASTDAANIRVIDLGQEPGWLPTLRVGGFANGHYQSGWFRAANGTKMRMYRSREARRLVLLPPRGNDSPVLLQAVDPDRFAEQIRREWN